MPSKPKSKQPAKLQIDRVEQYKLQHVNILLWDVVRGIGRRNFPLDPRKGALGKLRSATISLEKFTYELVEAADNPKEMNLK